MILGQENETFGDKLYNAFVANKENKDLEIDNNDLIITKAESYDRIKCILLCLGTFQMVLVLTLSVLLVKSVPHQQKSTFGGSNSGIKKLILYLFILSLDIFICRLPKIG